MTITTTAQAQARRVATEISASRLHPDYVQSVTDEIDAAFAFNDVSLLANAADQLDAYADAAGLHGIADDPDLTDQLRRWSGQLRDLGETQR